MNKDQIPTFTAAEIRRFQDSKWGMPPAEVLLAHRLQEQDPTVQAASRDKARRLQEQDPMSLLGASATEASKAFQGLQEASKDLVDLEIVIPGPEASAANALSSMGPRVPRLYGSQADLVRASMATRHTPKELREMSSKDFQLLQVLQKIAQPTFDLEQIRKDAELLASIPAEPREPWYKRLWSVFWDSRHDTVEESFARLHTSRKVLIDHFVDRIGGAPFRLWSWLRGTK